MITYVNTVLVSNLTSNNVITTKAAYEALTVSDAGKFVVITVDEKPAAGDDEFPVISATTAGNYNNIKIGLVTNKTNKQIDPEDKTMSDVPVIKWSNIISRDSLKSVVAHAHEQSSEESVEVDFTSLDNALVNDLAEGGRRVIVRLTFKDLPTRYRKWTESYEYVTVPGDTKATIAENIAKMINKEWKRARVNASYTAGATKFTLTAMPYDDDNTVDSLSWANKVRFNVNVYYTNPYAEGWASLNKNNLIGLVVKKIPGKQYIGEAKLVRDREAQAMGYLGILNRGEGTWPIIKPEMQTDLSKEYVATTIEFEREYRAADDIFRRTKEAVELYGAYTANANGLTGINAIIDAFKA
jgi:hypothetical protein